MVKDQYGHAFRVHSERCMRRATGGSALWEAFPIPAERRPLSARRRFEVLKRDGYRCQLCGAGADAVLEVDHRKPVAAGGTNSASNLWTLCRACNAGKATREV